MKNLKNMVVLGAILVLPIVLNSCGSKKSLTGKEVEISMNNEYQDTDNVWRSQAIYTSYDINLAKAGAMNLCRGELASKVSSLVKGGVSNYSKQVDTKNDKDDKSEVSLLTESEVTSIINKVISNSKILVNKMTRNSKTGKYTSTIVLELPKGDLTSMMEGRLKGDRENFKRYLETR